MRAKQLHSRYVALTHGRFLELLEKEDMLEKGDPKKESKKSQVKQQKLGDEACTVKLDDPTTIADTTIAYIRDGNMGGSYHCHDELRLSLCERRYRGTG